MWNQIPHILNGSLSYIPLLSGALQQVSPNEVLLITNLYFALRQAEEFS